MLGRPRFALTATMIIILTPARPMAITARNGSCTAYSLAWARGTTGIGVIPAGIAEASTDVAGMATGIMMAGAIAMVGVAESGMVIANSMATVMDTETDPDSQSKFRNGWHQGLPAVLFLTRRF